MKVIVMVKASKESEAGVMPSEQLLAAMGQFNEQLVRAGIVLAAEGLHPSSKGARVRFSGKNRTVIDGPFTETKELVAGFWLWQVKSMQEAIEWVKRRPNPMESDSDIEIRPVFASEDFGDLLTPELRQQSQQHQAEMDRYALESPRIENGREMLIVGPNVSYTFANRTNIPAQWSRFMPQATSLPGRIGNNTFGVCCHYKPGQGFDYLSGVEVRDASNLPQEFSQVRIPAARYAVFTHRKHVSAIAETLDAIWTKWLPNSGHQPADSPGFEHYDERFDPSTGLGEFEIWLPLKS